MTVWVMLIQMFRSGLTVVPGYYETDAACWQAANQAVIRYDARPDSLAKTANSITCVPVQKETLR